MVLKRMIAPEKGKVGDLIEDGGRPEWRNERLVITVDQVSVSNER